MKKPRLLLAALLSCAALLLFLHVRNIQQKGLEKFSTDFFDTFDTHVVFTAYTADREAFETYAGIVHEEMLRLHRLFDIYHDYGGVANLKTVNDNAGISAVEVAPEILDLLEVSKRACYETEGAVDISLGRVFALWSACREAALSGEGEPRLPDPDELRAAADVSVEDIVIDRENSTVFLRREGMRVDVGATAKGYATQKTIERLREAGLGSALLNAGGNVCAVGKPGDGREAWSVGVRSPDAGGEDALLDVVSVADRAVVSSGDDQRYFVVDGRKYHHIIDPGTLFPAENVRAVTVIHADAAVADILSTAAFILPLEKAGELVAGNGADAFWLLRDGTKIATRGYTVISKAARGSAE